IVIVVLITLIIIFIIFTFYKVIQTLQKLKETTDNLTSINNEFVEAKVKIENTNWILEKSALISEGISGLDDERELCHVVIKILNKQFQTSAIAIYVRKPASPVFIRRADHCVSTNLAIRDCI